MAIPDYQSVMLPHGVLLLRYAADEQEHSVREAIEALARCRRWRSARGRRRGCQAPEQDAGRQRALSRGGSIGIIGAARSGLVVGEDSQDEPRRILASTGGNLSKKATSLMCTIFTADNGAALVRWQGESAHSVGDLLRVPDDPEEKFALDGARPSGTPATDALTLTLVTVR